MELAARSGTTGDPVPELTGEEYRVLLGRLHKLLRPATYLEIGSRKGASLALASCATIAIDPEFQLDPAFMGRKPACHLYRMGSDEFFATHDPQAIFGRRVDFAFLDGLHLAEFLLRDFLNTERHCKPNSLIALHDCMPLDLAMARRVDRVPEAEKSPRRPNWWTGDVWKVVAILKQVRPNLRIHEFDAPPTGLVIVTGLDPESTLLRGRYFDLVDEMAAMGEAQFADPVRLAHLIPTRALTTAEDMARYFWL